MENNPKFKELPLKSFEDVVIRAYQHIDNGGHTIEVDQFSNVTIETGFFGYSQTRVMLSTIDIDSLVETLLAAKRRIEEKNIVRKLKGE